MGMESDDTADAVRAIKERNDEKNMVFKTGLIEGLWIKCLKTE